MSRRSRSISKSLSPEGREVMKIMEEAKAEIGRVNAEARHKKRQEAKKLVKGKSLTPPDQRVRVVTPEEVRKARKEKRRKRMERRKKKKEKKKTNSQREEAEEENAMLEAAAHQAALKAECDYEGRHGF